MQKFLRETILEGHNAFIMGGSKSDRATYICGLIKDKNIYLDSNNSTDIREYSEVNQVSLDSADLVVIPDIIMSEPDKRLEEHFKNNRQVVGCGTLKDVNELSFSIFDTVDTMENRVGHYIAILDDDFEISEVYYYNKSNMVKGYQKLDCKEIASYYANAMYFITCFTDIREYDIGDCRTFGFKTTFEEAEKALNENHCDMFECYYSYAVVEQIPPGIHPDVISRWFFKWDNEKDGFFAMEEPEELKHLVNIALG